jgi:hypothetical protein
MSALPTLLVALAFLLLAHAAMGQMARKDGTPPPRSLTPVTFQRPAAPDFGTAALSAVGIISYSVAPLYPPGDTFTDDFDAYRYPTAGSGYFGTAVNLPSGAIIDYIGLDYCDSDPSLSPGLTMFDSFGDHQFNTVGSITPPANVPCGYAYNAAALGYQLVANQGHQLSFVLNIPVNAGTIKFRGVEVLYRLAVSPAPGAATFNDVPTGHPFFQYIEALAASGITGGCQASPPLYCPDAPLTRGQMAVFLAKALGLHWPN